MGGTQSQEVGIWYTKRMDELIENQKKLQDRQAFLLETMIRVLEGNVPNKQATIDRLKVIKGNQRRLWS